MQAISQFSKVSIYLSTPRNITLTVTLLLHLFSKSEFPPIVSWQKIKMYLLARIEFLSIVSWQKLRKHSCISRFLQQSQKPVELYIFAHLRFSFMINMINPSQANFISSSSVLFIDQLFYCFTRVHLLYERNR